MIIETTSGRTHDLSMLLLRRGARAYQVMHIAPIADTALQVGNVVWAASDKMFFADGGVVYAEVSMEAHHLARQYKLFAGKSGILKP